MTTENNNTIISLRNNCLHHISLADGMHTMWSLMEHLNVVVNFVALVSAIICFSYLLVTGELLVSYLTWCTLILGWFIFQLLIEWGINIVRKRMKNHQLEANRLARRIEDMGFTRPIF